MQRPIITDWKAPDYSAVYRFRNWNYNRLKRGGQDAWDAAWSYYASHPCEAITDWVTTYDPRLAALGRDPYLPFVLFPRQREAVDWMWNCYKEQDERVMEKSRDCGATWMAVGFSWWLWTFHSGVQIGFGSRKEKLVDNIGDPDTILQKFRMVLDRMPLEMKPIGFNTNEDYPFMRIKNRENGSVIIGQGGRNIGRGGRSSLYFVDEAAFLEHPEEAEAALSANSDAKIWLSTPNGTGNPFYRKRFSGNFKVFTFHWSEDPRKDQAWYDKKKQTLEPEVFAQEVDLDYEASDTQIVIPSLWVRASQALRQALERDGLMPTLAAQGSIAGLDVAGGGAAKSVLIPRNGPTVGKSIAWSDEDTINTAGRAREAADQVGAWIIKFDSIGIGRGVAAAFRRMPGLITQGVNVGDRPTRERWPDKKRACDKFVNLKAELWWIVRDALRRTYEHWLHYEGRDGVAHDVDDLLLLPSDDALCAELSLPRYFYTESGKIQIESKKQMAARGVASPDHADALVLTYAPRKSTKKSTRVRARW